MLSWKRTVPLALLAGCCIPALRAEVTLTETDVPVGDSTVPSYVFENQYLQVAVRKSDGRVFGLVKKTGPGSGGNQAVPGYPSFWDRIGQDGATGQTLTPDPKGDDSSAKRSLQVTENVTATATDLGTASFQVTKLYTLTDNSKAFCADITVTNPDAFVVWNAASPLDGQESLMYVAPGGSAPSGDEIQVKTANGIDTATSGTNYWGAAPSGSTARPELAEGWFAAVDPGDTPAETVDVLVTWPLDVQKAHATNGQTTLRMYTGGDRFQMHPIFNNIQGGETYSYRQCVVVDDGIPLVSYAAPDTLAAGVSLSTKTPAQGGYLTATFYLNSLSQQSASYDIKNIRLVDAGGSAIATAANLAGLAVAANAHASATRQLQVPASAAAGTYLLKADLYPAGGATALTTLISTAILVTPADVKVNLVQDPGSGKWILENEVIRATINAKGEVEEYVLKTAGDRNQANSTYTLFRDYVRPLGSNTAFSKYTASVDPQGTDSPLKKTLQFSSTFDNTYVDLVKTYSLESMSRSLQVDFNVTNVLLDPIGGQGFFSHVAMAPGGSGNAADQFTARAGETLLAPHQASTRYWMGAEPNADGTAKLAALPELTEGWMAVTDTSVTDAMALSWDLAKQKQFSLTPTDGTVPVTMSSVFEASGFGRHVLEPHFTNIPAGATLATTEYAMGDTGFQSISYAEGKRVMAGVWANGPEFPVGVTLGATAGLTNTGTTARTFDLQNIRLVDSAGTAAPAGPDVTGIALDPAAHKDVDLSFAILAAQPAGAYTLRADLHENGAKVATLESLPFALIAAPVADGDLNGDAKVDSADVTIALSIAGGLQTATTEQVGHGNLVPATPGLTIEDAIAIARKANNL